MRQHEMYATNPCIDGRWDVGRWLPACRRPLPHKLSQAPYLLPSREECETCDQAEMSPSIGPWWAPIQHH